MRASPNLGPDGRPGVSVTKGKVYDSAAAALDGVLFDGMSILSGGFGATGNPEHLIAEIAISGVQRLTLISNNCGGEVVCDHERTGYGLHALVERDQVRRFIGSYVGSNKLLERRCLDGVVDLELVPQGTLAERIRAGGAGIPAFFTPTAVGTELAAGKQSQVFSGRKCVLETAIVADLAIVRAWKGDHAGNLVFRKTARNFNPEMATAGQLTIAEVEELVEPGALDPNYIHTPGIYVDRIVLCANYSRLVEQPLAGKGEPVS